MFFVQQRRGSHPSFVSLHRTHPVHRTLNPPAVAGDSYLTQEIEATLGLGGLTQQVRAENQQGMNLLMHAARHARSTEVFSSALSSVKHLTKQEVVAEILADRQHWDIHGKNLLHHGVEGCDEEMLSEVCATYVVEGEPHALAGGYTCGHRL